MHESTHIPYRQLPTEARMLFFMLSLPAFAKHSPVPPKPYGVANTLQEIWTAMISRSRISAIPTS